MQHRMQALRRLKALSGVAVKKGQGIRVSDARVG